MLLERMMALHPKIIDLTLDRVWRLLDRLGHPEDHLPPVIHVAGTNGKGSTQAMIRAGLEQAGQKVCHAYTSPHLARFHERIRLAGEIISEPALAELLAETEAANGPDPITYFEITTCAAFLAFARTPADALLLEVGLGGRLDATNVVDAARRCVITPVSLDHQQYLGETVDLIAGEKAGILKPGVPCVVGPQHPEGLASDRGPGRGRGRPADRGEPRLAGLVRTRAAGVSGYEWLLDLPLPNLPGPHQIENAGAALAVLRALGHGRRLRGRRDPRLLACADAAVAAGTAGGGWRRGGVVAGRRPQPRRRRGAGRDAGAMPRARPMRFAAC
jgi:dihydrofolate synthase / folylpolyglutamate synthase